MGDLARRRARPWLVASSIVLLLVSLLVAWVMLWVVANARRRSLYGLYDEMALTVAWFDLVIAALIGASILLQGQAVVAYEVFTGRTLPRRGLRRYWRSVVLLAGGYSALVGWSLTLQLRPIYILLLSMLLLILFYALFSWRSDVERERSMAQLRPFVASQRMYERLLAPTSPPDVDVTPPFRALCEDVLGARVAYLVPLGPLARWLVRPWSIPMGLIPGHRRWPRWGANFAPPICYTCRSTPPATPAPAGPGPCSLFSDPSAYSSVRSSG